MGRAMAAVMAAALVAIATGLLLGAAAIVPFIVGFPR